MPEARAQKTEIRSDHARGAPMQRQCARAQWLWPFEDGFCRVFQYGNELHWPAARRHVQVCFETGLICSREIRKGLRDIGAAQAVLTCSARWAGEDVQVHDAQAWM